MNPAIMNAFQSNDWANSPESWLLSLLIALPIILLFRRVRGDWPFDTPESPKPEAAKEVLVVTIFYEHSPQRPAGKQWAAYYPAEYLSGGTAFRHFGGTPEEACQKMTACVQKDHPDVKVRCIFRQGQAPQTPEV